MRPRKSWRTPRVRRRPRPNNSAIASASSEDENKRDLEQITDLRGKIGVADAERQDALLEAGAKREETVLLRTQKSAVEKQANEFKLRQAELIDNIRELERIQETATRNNTDLREKVAKFTTLLQKNGLSTDISQIKGLESPPPVEGLIKRVDATNRRVEITIGSNDGLVDGHDCISSVSNRAPNTWARSKSSRSTPIRPWAGSLATPSRARR